MKENSHDLAKQLADLIYGEQLRKYPEDSDMAARMGLAYTVGYLTSIIGSLADTHSSARKQLEQDVLRLL